MLRRLRCGIRTYKVLAIESSCDDSCVSLIDRSAGAKPIVLDHVKSTLNSVKAGGVIPTSAHLHHQKSIAGLVKQVLQKHNISGVNCPELVCVTRGPGMPGSLSIGVDTAKGLSVAWGSQFLGVHHMLGHLLIPRLESNGEEPQFPFLSLLASGGHTMLVLSRSLLDHEILVNTIDIAAGDALDKCAREIGIRGNMIGKELELFLNKNPQLSLKDIPWEMPQPLKNKPKRVDTLGFSFTPFISGVKLSLERYHNNEVKDELMPAMGFRIQEAIFDHIIDRVLVAYKVRPELNQIKTFVGSGGVVANQRLRVKLQAALKSHGVENFHFPPPALCTDNAIMIGWAGIELYENGVTSELDVTPLRKWSVEGLEKSGF
ncbi:Mitochondrial tRNAs modification protein [Komagataella phaffii CBS 7435]|uniref:N(6)-L-threonylcarbamoyladenine synthase n=2 Tax=Komagataella phaffii TaxID=460519 RepID=C4QZU9_KOMPG|nr:uncharacterized protein PAS_chr2-1_0167 [Komagataella phaffii GS115]AOA62453.1 GQ67_00192T0 [Komagataella phaffii]CAH2448729.1 Mitochondrial tRNAs modification protein [Komagataella phaffii CBS 7435]AOA68168.1 GQ68_01196T0 [Komagataella phaffii GS115]CAY68773.1 Putative metalloprotease, similar to O-sialoglycoprotein metallopeptidase from P. haemolytica [Komagataella phaffii GS115]CCA38820.2 Mitochondrial tRNAs modification protein [Komagataella phaffii CBS 7435]